MQKYIAVVFGSTGEIGSKFIEVLSKNDNCEKVVAISRKKIENLDKKVENIVWEDFGYHLDFDKSPKEETLKQLKDTKGSVCFSCMGTTRSQCKDDKTYEKLTKTYSEKIGEICKQASIEKHYFISSEGAKKDSYMSYPKFKGQVEESLSKLGFEGIARVRPALLVTDAPRTSRKAEYYMSYLTGFLNYFNFNLDIHVRDVAKACIQHFQINQSKKFGDVILDTKELKKLAKEYDKI